MVTVVTKVELDNLASTRFAKAQVAYFDNVLGFYEDLKKELGDKLILNKYGVEFTRAMFASSHIPPIFFEVYNTLKNQ